MAHTLPGYWADKLICHASQCHARRQQHAHNFRASGCRQASWSPVRMAMSWLCTTLITEMLWSAPETACRFPPVRSKLQQPAAARAAAAQGLPHRCKLQPLTGGSQHWQKSQSQWCSPAERPHVARSSLWVPPPTYSMTAPALHRHDNACPDGQLKSEQHAGAHPNLGSAACLQLSRQFQLRPLKHKPPQAHPSR